MTARDSAGEQPVSVTGQRQRKSVEFFAPEEIHVKEKLTVEKVRMEAWIQID